MFACPLPPTLVCLCRAGRVTSQRTRTVRMYKHRHAKLDNRGLEVGASADALNLVAMLAAPVVLLDEQDAD